MPNYFTPWRVTDPVARPVAWLNPILLAFTVLMILNDAFRWPFFLVLALTLIFGVRMIIKAIRDTRRATHAMDYMIQLLDGKIAEHQVPPHVQEDIKIEHAHRKLWR